MGITTGTSLKIRHPLFSRIGKFLHRFQVMDLRVNKYKVLTNQIHHLTHGPETELSHGPENEEYDTRHDENAEVTVGRDSKHVYLWWW
jgi:negative regulator of sigma E activity